MKHGGCTADKGPRSNEARGLYGIHHVRGFLSSHSLDFFELLFQFFDLLTASSSLDTAGRERCVCVMCVCVCVCVC